MNIARRDVIKGLVLSGVSGVLTGRLAAFAANAGEHFRLASQPGSIQILVAGSSLDAPFVEGALASARHFGANPSVVCLNKSLVDDLSQARDLLAGMLQSRGPLVALLSPADGVLLVELARSNGLRLPVVGRHTVSGPALMHRHHLSTAMQSETPGASFLDGLGNQNWPALLGGSLVQIACGSTRPCSLGRQESLSQADRGPQRPENLTSLFIQG